MSGMVSLGPRFGFVILFRCRVRHVWRTAIIHVSLLNCGVAPRVEKIAGGARPTGAGRSAICNVVGQRRLCSALSLVHSFQSTPAFSFIALSLSAAPPHADGHHAL